MVANHEYTATISRCIAGEKLFSMDKFSLHFKQRRLALLKHCLIIFENCNHVAVHNGLDDGFTKLKTEESKVEFNS